MFRNFCAVLTAFAFLTGWTLAEEREEQRLKRVVSSEINNVRLNNLNDEGNSRKSRNSQEFNFPIVLPPYYDVELEKKNFGSCLLYLESISVVVFAYGDKVVTKRDFSSASAIVSGGASQKNKFLFDNNFVNCPDKDNNNNTVSKEFSFRINVIIKEPTEAKSLKDNSEVLFSVSNDLDLTLKFKIQPDSSWNLVDLQLESPLNIKKGSWLAEDLSVKAGKSSLNAALVNFGGFRDYNYACSSTPLIAWSFGDAKNLANVGISFNNIQLQAFDIRDVELSTDSMTNERKYYRFSTTVNDCVGTFTIGSWMSIVVILILLMVLSFGYLMLNSVQTMDRFDDLKQKQLIINAKE